MSFLIKENDEVNKQMMEAGIKNLMLINSSDCETNLKIDGIRINEKGKQHELDKSLAQVRPYVRSLREREK